MTERLIEGNPDFWRERERSRETSVLVDQILSGGTMYEIEIREVVEDGPDRDLLNVTMEKLDLELVYKAIFAPDSFKQKAGFGIDPIFTVMAQNEELSDTLAALGADVELIIDFLDIVEE